MTGTDGARNTGTKEPSFEFLRSYVGELPSVIHAAGEYGFELPPGLPAHQIRGIQQAAGGPLPDALIALFRETYGAQLGGYWLLTAPEITAARRELARAYGEEWRPELVPFVQLVGSEDYLILDPADRRKEGEAVLDGDRTQPLPNWSVVCHGLRAWLEKMVAADFRAFWLEED